MCFQLAALSRLLEFLWQWWLNDQNFVRNAKWWLKMFDLDQTWKTISMQSWKRQLNCRTWCSSNTMPNENAPPFSQGLSIGCGSSQAKFECKKTTTKNEQNSEKKEENRKTSKSPPTHVIVKNIVATNSRYMFLTFHFWSFVKISLLAMSALFHVKAKFNWSDGDAHCAIK